MKTGAAMGVTIDPDKKSGGGAYERMIWEAVSALPGVESLLPPPCRGIPTYAGRMFAGALRFPRGYPTLLLTLNPALFLRWRRNAASRKILMWHHYDPDAFAGGRIMLGLFYELLFKRLLRHAGEIDCLVVEGTYWRSFFTRFPFRRIEIIYNAFDLAGYETHRDRVAAVRHQLNPENRIMIYVGQLLRYKGVREIHGALGSSDRYLLVGSGARDADLPIRHFSGTFDEYKHMLAACDVSLSMSKMWEGWNRTAHESLLVGTPVIGNGVGNSGELLEGAGQRIVHGAGELPGAVEEVLSRRQEYARAGRAYAAQAQFDKAWFGERWRQVVRSVSVEAETGRGP